MVCLLYLTGAVIDFKLVKGTRAYQLFNDFVERYDGFNQSIIDQLHMGQISALAGKVGGKALRLSSVITTILAG